MKGKSFIFAIALLLVSQHRLAFGWEPTIEGVQEFRMEQHALLSNQKDKIEAAHYAADELAQLISKHCLAENIQMQQHGNGICNQDLCLESSSKIGRSDVIEVHLEGSIYSQQWTVKIGIQWTPGNSQGDSKHCVRANDLEVVKNTYRDVLAALVK